MAASVTEPITQAFETTRRVLFEKFDVSKWLSLGFIAFLAALGESGASVPNFNGFGSSRPGAGFGGLPPELQEALDWMRDHVSMVIAIAVVGVALGMVLQVLLVWVSSRGKLMLVEAVLWDRQAVSEPWARLRDLGWSLFKLRIVIGLSGLLVTLSILGLAAFAAYPDLRSGHWGTAATTALLIVLLFFVFVALPLVIVSQVIDDFLVPVMYREQKTVAPAWATCRAALFRGNAGVIVLFYLMKFVLSIAVGMLAFVLTCVTCCIAGLPYLGTVILLPIHVFWRAYSLHFIESLGMRLFPERPQRTGWYYPEERRF